MGLQRLQTQTRILLLFMDHPMQLFRSEDVSEAVGTVKNNARRHLVVLMRCGLVGRTKPSSEGHGAAPDLWFLA